jgi:hypothetical protein
MLGGNTIAEFGGIMLQHEPKVLEAQVEKVERTRECQ